MENHKFHTLIIGVCVCVHTLIIGVCVCVCMYSHMRELNVYMTYVIYPEETLSICVSSISIDTLTFHSNARLFSIYRKEDWRGWGLKFDLLFDFGTGIIFGIFFTRSVLDNKFKNTKCKAYIFILRELNMCVMIINGIFQSML